MSKITSKSPSEAVLTPGGGGSLGQIAPPQPSPLLAPGESPKPSSVLAQAEKPKTSTHHGKLRLSNGGQSALTAQKELTTPKSTLAGTLNWALIGLQKYGAIDVVLNMDANRYEIHLPVSTWTLDNDLLILAEEPK